jgi:ABC-type antimicrobial peptide transport system permease subunit
VILSSVAGLIGLVGGFLACGGLVYAGTKLIPNLKFEWILNPWAVVISSGAIVLTGIVSGMIPAMRAEKLSIIEALRAE